MSNYRPEAYPNPRPDLELDPLPHVEAMQARHFVNGRLNDDFGALAHLRNARVQPAGFDDRMTKAGQIRRFSNGIYRFQDVFCISRADQEHPDFPEEFLLDSLGVSPVEGYGNIHSVILERITSVEPAQLYGVDCIRITCTAENAPIGTIRRDLLTFRLQDNLEEGSMPRADAHIGYAVWHGERVIEQRMRDPNADATLRDVHGILQVVSLLRAELEMGPLSVDDLRMPE